ncbi:MAG: hypothetical protein Q8R18_03295 [bacterium]|nr:hypothetical protein [bacterium]
MVSSLEKLVLGVITLVSLSRCRDISYDTESGGYVVLYPSNPSMEDDLHCFVEDYENTAFDFYWMKDGATYKTSTGTSSLLENVSFHSGDYVECSAWVPESSQYDSFEIGTSGVYIQ